VIPVLVQVQWTNNRYDYIQDFMLDGLIEMGVVARFWRESGWVTIGIDLIRGDGDVKDYRGNERRATFQSAADPQ
jgi:hypothetical protein